MGTLVPNGLIMRFTWYDTFTHFVTTSLLLHLLASIIQQMVQSNWIRVHLNNWNITMELLMKGKSHITGLSESHKTFSVARGVFVKGIFEPNGRIIKTLIKRFFKKVLDRSLAVLKIISSDITKMLFSSPQRFFASKEENLKIKWQCVCEQVSQKDYLGRCCLKDLKRKRTNSKTVSVSK